MCGRPTAGTGHAIHAGPGWAAAASRKAFSSPAAAFFLWKRALARLAGCARRGEQVARIAAAAKSVRSRRPTNSVLVIGVLRLDRDRPVDRREPDDGGRRISELDRA